MPTLTCMYGAPGSGKTYFTKRHANPAQIVSLDEIRGQLTGDPADQTRNQDVIRLAHAMIDNLLADGQDVWVDATHLNPNAREEMLSLATKHNATSTLIVMTTSAPVCEARNKNRNRVVPTHAMRRMLTQQHQQTRTLKQEAWTRILNDHEYETSLQPA